MPFEKGQKKIEGSGRKKRDRAKLPPIESYLANTGVNPIRELIALVPKLKPAAQADIWQTLLVYCYPRIAVERKPTSPLDAIGEDTAVPEPESTETLLAVIGRPKPKITRPMSTQSESANPNADTGKSSSPSLGSERDDV